MTNRLTRAELLRRAALGGAAAAAPSLFAGTAHGATGRPARVRTDGNKPEVHYLNAFTERVAEFPRIAYYPLEDGGEAAVAMVIDEILVGKQAASDPDVLAFLNDQADDTKQTVFGGKLLRSTSRPPEDVQIWRVRDTPGQQQSPDVAMFVWEARAKLQEKGIPPEQIAPNHVLIPSSNPSFNYHTCPGGPPEKAKNKGTIPPRTTQ